MFYDNFVKACNLHNKAPSAVAIDIGISKATVTGWKNGSTPSDATLHKLADYFGVSPEDLTGSTGPAQRNTPDGHAQPDFIVKYNQLTPEGQKEVLAFIEFKQAQEASIAARGGKAVKKPSPSSTETLDRLSEATREAADQENNQY
ncbi:MAG: helix-turn-helix transcriptional regulator [Dysosmobacter sp.]|nr:helix-turn-helix transcriptional regulator [Dysosmobacter sp.]